MNLPEFNLYAFSSINSDITLLSFSLSTFLSSSPTSSAKSKNAFVYSAIFSFVISEKSLSATKFCHIPSMSTSGRASFNLDAIDGLPVVNSENKPLIKLDLKFFSDSK